MEKMEEPKNENEKKETIGFILTRHVRDEYTNQYWNECIRCIRRLYLQEMIVIIDDASIKNHVRTFDTTSLENVIIVDSEFPPGVGELLPYYYFWRYHYFDFAVILHDSAFIQQLLPLRLLVAREYEIVPLWHFIKHRHENLKRTMQMASALQFGQRIREHLSKSGSFLSISISMGDDESYSGCFGCQAFIKHTCLIRLQEEYHLFNLIPIIKCRADRCCLERILGAIIYDYLENIKQIKQINIKERKPMKSLLGEIYNYSKLNYSYSEYQNNKPMLQMLPIIKVWTGR